MIDVARAVARLVDGRETAVFRISVPGGIAITVAELGATLMRIDVPDRDGHRANVLLGFDDIADYPSAGGAGGDACLGGTCGRFANRIGGASFDLDGRTVRLVPNEGPHQLHGGPDGYHRRLWRGARIRDGVLLSIDSPDGDQGWPGRVQATAAFQLAGHDQVRITYCATSDRPTFVNLVSHGYYNLDGARDILGHELRIASDRFLPIDAAAIPTGEVRDVAGGPFDFRSARTIADAMACPDAQLRSDLGYNHCYVLPGDGVRAVAWLRALASGRIMELATDQPGLIFYDGYGLGRGNAGFPDRAGLCLEAQAWPDGPNRPGAVSLRPGETYRSQLILRFGITD